MPLYNPPTGGGGGSPGGSNTQLQYNNSGSFGGDSGFTYAGTGQATLALGTITATAKALNVTATWNSGATTFDAPIFANVTDTASAAASKLIEVQVGGTSAFTLRKDGTIIMPTGGSGVVYQDSVGGPTFSNQPGIALWDTLAASGAAGAYVWGGTFTTISVWGSGTQFDQTSQLSPAALSLHNGAPLRWNSGATLSGAYDTGLHRSAAGVVIVNDGSTSTSSNYRDIVARGVRSNAVTFANAIASPVEGTIQAFTDSSTATWGATITGGGANHVLGYYNGTNWKVMG